MLPPVSRNIYTKYILNHKHRRLMYYYDSLDVEELDPLTLAFEDEDEDDLDDDFDDDDFDDDDFDDEDWDDLDEEEWEDEDDYYEEEDDDDFY